MALRCKNCECETIIKNGTKRGKQRYRCKECQYNFVIGDSRSKASTDIKKALSVILYSLGKASFGFLAKLFSVSRTTTYKWIKQIADDIEEPAISSSIKEIEFDEMWYFIQSKKTKDGSSKHWIVAQGEPLPGLSVIVMLKPLEDCTIKLSI